MQLFRPPEDLRGAVECAVGIERAAGSMSRFPAMPRAMLTAVRVGEGVPSVMFHTVTTRAVVHTHPLAVRAVGLVLWPQAAAQLLGSSTGACADAVLPWAELAGAGEASHLDSVLYSARDDAARLQALQSSVRRVLNRGPARVRRARADMLRYLCLTVGQDGARAATALGIGERQLERRCRALLALTPKQMQRITRWHGLLSTAVQGPVLPDAELALAMGYYDQSHLAREARQLAGTPLRDLLRQAHGQSPWWALQTPRLQRAVAG